MSTKTLAHILLLATVLVWGSTFTLVKSALADSTPLLFNLLRFTLATVALALINHRSLRAITRPQLISGATAGLFLALGYQLQTLGLARTTPAKSAFITGLVVVFVPALTRIPFIRRAIDRASSMTVPPSWMGEATGAALAFLGLILLTTPAGTALRDLASSISLGDLLTLGCALAFAAHLLTLSTASKAMPIGILATLQVGCATVFMLITLPFEHPHAAPTPRLIFTLLVCALFATAAAFTIQSFAQQTLPPTHTVLLLTFEPVFAWLTSLVVLHERLTPRSLLGAALIFLAILAVEFLPTTHSTEIPA